MDDRADEPTSALPERARIGRVALRVGSLDRVRPFYRDALGFAVDFDGSSARLHAGDGATRLLLREDPGAPERPADAAGLFHLAVRVPDRAALADALDRVREAGVTLTGASDHLVSEALYLRDPEGNGVEIYRDRPRDDWSRTDDGGVAMDTLPLDLDDLAAAGRGDGRLPAGTDIGHVHLEVTDRPRAERFYVDGLGMTVRARYGDAAVFVAAGDYHHHIGLNTWNGRRAPAGDARGLEWFEVVVPDRDALDATIRRFADRGDDPEKRDGEAVVADPDGIRIRLTSGETD